MACKTQKIQDSSSDDDAPEVVAHSVSQADAKRSQKALHDFEEEEKARRKARNRERDQKLKERARVTRGEKVGDKPKKVGFVVPEVGEDESKSGENDGSEGNDGVETRMLRAMRDAADEVESGGEDEFREFGQGMDSDDGIASSSDDSFAQADDDDAEMSLEESDLVDPEAPTDDDEMGEDEEAPPHQADIPRSSKKADYLADDLFTAAFASQNSKSAPNKNTESTQQTAKKQRRKSTARPKDLVIGGRTICTLSRLSDPRSQATARSVPSARARRFVDQSLAMKGKQALLKAKKKGWERRPANVGVMKYQGAPHGFARMTR